MKIGHHDPSDLLSFAADIGLPHLEPRTRLELGHRNLHWVGGLHVKAMNPRRGSPDEHGGGRQGATDGIEQHPSVVGRSHPAIESRANALPRFAAQRA